MSRFVSVWDREKEIFILYLNIGDIFALNLLPELGIDVEVREGGGPQAPALPRSHPALSPCTEHGVRVPGRGLDIFRSHSSESSINCLQLDIYNKQYKFRGK